MQPSWIPKRGSKKTIYLNSIHPPTDDTLTISAGFELEMLNFNEKNLQFHDIEISSNFYSRI